MRRLVLAIALALSHMAVVETAAETNVEQTATGPTIDGMALTISCSNETYRLGERISIHVMTQNNRKEIVDFGKRRGEWTPILTDAGGHLVSNMFLRNRSAQILHGQRMKFLRGVSGSFIDVKLEVAPGEAQKHRDIMLDKFYSVSSPGLYRLILIFCPYSRAEELLFSNMIEFRVLEAETDPENE